MICMTIKVKHLPPTQAPFEARFKKALRLNRDPVLFFAHQTGYQELGGRLPSYSSTKLAYCCQGGSTASTRVKLGVLFVSSKKENKH